LSLNFADDEMLRVQSQLTTQGGIVDGIQEGFQLEAAEDARVHFRFADAGGEIQPGHGGRRTKEMVRHAGGMAFCCGENQVGQGALEIPEGRAVDVMNDHRHASAPGGEATQDAGLAAVGVHKVGLLRAQEVGQFAERDEILQRMHGADQFGNHGEQAGDLGGFSFQRALRADGGAGDEFDVQARLLA
jgi:hypothetical protein